MYYLILPENALGIINPYGNTFTRLGLNIKTTQRDIILLYWNGYISVRAKSVLCLLPC